MVVDYSQERPREAATAAEITDSRSTPGYRRGGLGGRRGSSRKIVFGVQKQKENNGKEGDADTNDLLSLCTSLPASTTKKDAATTTPSPSSNKPRPHMMGRRSASFKFGVPDNRFGFEELKKTLSQQNLMDEEEEEEKTTTLAFPRETQQRRSTMPLSFFSSSDHDAKSTAAVAETITPPNVRHARGGNALQSLHQLCGSRRNLAERQATATTEPMSGESEEDSDYNPEDEEDDDDSVSIYSTSTYGYDDSDLDLKYDHDDDDDEDNNDGPKPVKLRPPKTPIPKAPIVPTRIQVIPASPDETDLGYGDATPEPDLGYGDATPSKEPPDLGYGDATPQQPQKQQKQQPSPRGGRGSMGFMPPAAACKGQFNPRSYFATRRENSRRGSMNTGLARFPHHNHRRCTMQHLTIREKSGGHSNTHTEPQTADFQLPTRRRSNSMNMLGGGGNNTTKHANTEKRLSMGAGKSERVIPSSQTNGVASQLSFRRRGSNQSMGSRRNSMDDSQYQEPTAFVTRSTIRRIDNTSEQIDLVGGRRTAVLAGPNPVV